MTATRRVRCPGGVVRSPRDLKHEGVTALEQVVDGAEGGVDAPAAQLVPQRVEVVHGVSPHGEGRKDPS
jgi:hypothetical protein